MKDPAPVHSTPTESPAPSPDVPIVHLGFQTDLRPGKDRGMRSGMPINQRWLTTTDVAELLQLSRKTVQRLCKRGLIDADLTSGRQWRTTMTRLSRSSYLHTKKRGKTPDASLES